MQRRSFLCALGILLVPSASRTQELSAPALWELLRSGEAVAVMRHALAPGTGDPDNFALGDCTTQRNLSDEGRDQARAIGARFRANGIENADVLTSQWCRCRETAELLGIGTPQEFPPLNSFFADRSTADTQTAATLERIGSRDPARPLVLVTHQVNVTALTGIFPRSGAIVVARLGADGQVEVSGML